MRRAKLFLTEVAGKGSIYKSFMTLSFCTWLSVNQNMHFAVHLVKVVKVKMVIFDFGCGYFAHYI